MKITISKENLLYGIQTVQKAISTKNTIPTLSGIKFKVENNRLYFTATDLEIGIECHVPIEAIEDGEIVLPARHLSELVRKLPDTKITINYLPEITGVEIKYDDSEVVLKGWPGDEFPLIPDFEGDYAFEINPNVLKNMIKQTIFATTSDDTRPIFTGALFEIENDHLKIITTDTHRLALRSGKVNVLNDQAINVIIPGKTLSEVNRITKDEEELIKINGNTKQICFETEDTKIISRLIDGKFPNYRQVIPNDPKTFLKIKTKSLQHTVERANLFSNEKDGTSVINLHIENGTLQVTSQSELGKVEEKISVLDEGEPMTIAFNAKYLLDVLKVMDTEDLDFNLTGSLSPAIVKPGNHDNFIYVILPIRVV
ncbi:DNA polymerase-3 subunit beta [Desulfonispora thiosulfatigenes DSM 11270]|uniref:Beta sliding clamp n=1 Tax=Desulfonispora thiosulfatigenes DSM 11270 TaxID=656914 RepID=A0A1W1V2G6_DESTI|nr:DNA polymerase III subunit beta [Desulfonispora thiosulfatigenes]SMB87498.1 DNA polymerase-3 subunit beta [Desulfonispora thiosulfatigenes DSM 11270]